MLCYTARKSACFTFLCPSACYLCVLQFHWGNIHADKHAPGHLLRFPHVFFQVTTGKCIQGTHGVPLQPKVHLSVLEVQINMLLQRETKDPRADFVLCFPTVWCDAPFTNPKFSSPTLQKQQSSGGETGKQLTEQLIPCLSRSLSFLAD